MALCPLPWEAGPRMNNFGPLLLGRHIIADPIFLDGLGSTPAHQTRWNPDILARALTLAGAERVPLEEF